MRNIRDYDLPESKASPPMPSVKSPKNQNFIGKRSEKLVRKNVEQKNEISRKESEKELAFMLAKYDLSITSDWDDLLSSIIYKNKYLYLAHYLRKNREDWNNGYNYAECGLSNFDVETEQDQQICDCINNIITTYEDVDGRYFRDCEWSYDVLYGIAKEENPSLYEDYEKMCGKTDDY